MLGAVLVPIGHTSGTSELRHALRESGARALLVGNWRDPGFPFDVLTDVAGQLEHVIVVGDLPAPEGVIRFDDIGWIDGEGYLTIVDRKKDIIIRAGMNISAAVEAVLTSMPQIADIAVVAAPDPRTGEHACAFVRPAPGYDTVTISEKREHMERAGLAKYKWPVEIRSHSTDFPRTAAGKVRKADLRTLLS